LPLGGQNRARDLLAVVVRRSRPAKIDFAALELNGCRLIFQLGSQSESKKVSIR
jgi:hypothetical protein